MLDGAPDAVCRDALSRWGVPGAVVGVLAGGTTEIRGYGVADLRTGVPVRPDTSFRVASITKPFTATLAVLLAEERRLSLDDRAPGLPAPGATLAQALAHVTGLEGESGDLARFGDGDDALARAVDGLAGLQRLVPPGEAFSYCNAGYWAAGLACARAAGTTYEDAVEERIIGPLGLTSTAFGFPEARGHVQPVPGEPLHERIDDPSYPRARRPSGGLVSTAPDLLRFAAFHLADPRAAVMREPRTITPSGAYGLGWWHEVVEDVDVWSHLGTYGGFQSLLALVPARQAAFVLLTNGDAGDAVRTEVADALLAELAGVRRRPAPTVPVADGELGELAGRYASDQMEVTVSARGDSVALDVAELDPSGGRTPLPTLEARPLGGRTFAVVGGQWDGDLFDFHPATGPPRFVRLSVLVPRC